MKYPIFFISVIIAHFPIALFGQDTILTKPIVMDTLLQNTDTSDTVVRENLPDTLINSNPLIDSLAVDKISATMQNDSVFVNPVPFIFKPDTIKKEKPDPETYLNYIDQYFKKYPPKNSFDSSFLASFNYLNTFIKTDSLRFTIKQTDKIIRTNRLKKELLNMIPYRDTLDSLNRVRQDFLADYWEHKRLKAMADTSDMASTDTMFIKVLEQVMYQDTINFDSILALYQPYHDTILNAINKSIAIFSNSWFMHWVQQMRRDTINFYLVDLEGDSMLMRLYNGSPEMVRYNITDYWGNNVQAVIRNINKNSFRILIDNTPIVEYETDEKARQAIGSLKRLQCNKINLTLLKRPYNPPVQHWILGGNANLDMSQVALHQWSTGGQSTISLLSGLNLFANYKGDKFKWENTATFRYGVIRQGDYTDTVEFRPNEDKIELNSTYGRTIFGNFSTSVMGNFKSQFAKAYEWSGNEKTDKQLSQFMSPGYVTFALGLDYKLKKQNLKLFLSPLSSKSTFVLLNNATIRTTMGLDSTKNVRHEMGASFKGSYKFKFLGNIELDNKLTLFSNYMRKPQNVDVDWEFTFIFPVNDYIRATISSNIIYDDDVNVTRKNILDSEGNPTEGPGIQIREMLTIGFAVKF